MESALRPREIQSRIRAGESVDEVARAAGVPVERIEPYAGPVLAEREHIAAQAQRGSVRRRGETTGHRVLRTAVADRLATRGVDPETVSWDSMRMDDGRWSVTANYASGEATREAVFYFDTRGRFSVAANDDARWMLNEQSPSHGPQPGRRRPTGAQDADGDTDADGEPTLDLNDELALVRAIQDPALTDPVSDSVTVTEVSETEVTMTEVEIEVDVVDGAASSEDAGEPTVVRLVPRSEDERPAPAEPAAGSAGAEEGAEEGAADDDEPVAELDEASELDLLFDMLGGEGYSEDSGRVYPGLAEPSTEAGWEPAVVVNYPVEPVAEHEPGAERDPASAAPSDDTSDEEEQDIDRDGEAAALRDEPEELELPLEETSELPPAPNAVTDNDASVEDAVPESTEAPASAAAAGSTSAAAPGDVRDDVEADQVGEDQVGEDRSGAQTPAKKAPAKKRKRAEVPSWDEIMFGGPKRP